MNQREESILPEPRGFMVSERPSRLRYASEECLESDGWTKAAIAKFLPAVPDLIAPSPFGKVGGPPMKYWLRRRVTQVRKTNKECQEWLMRAAVRHANALEKERVEKLRRLRAALGSPDFD